MKVSLNKQQKGLFSRQLANLSTGSSLRNLLEKIQRHRGMVNLYLKGDQSFKPKIIMLQEEINQQLNMLKKEVENTASYSDKLNEINSGFDSLQAGSFTMSSEECIAGHGALIQSLLVFMVVVAEQNQLVRDNNFSNKYINIIWRLIPITAESLGKARALGSGVAAVGRSSALERVKLGFLVNKIRISISLVLKQINTLPDTSNQSSKAYKKMHTDLSDFCELIEKELIVATNPNIEATRFFDDATRLLGELFSLYDSAVAMAASEIKTSIEELERSNKRIYMSGLGTLSVVILMPFLLMS